MKIAVTGANGYFAWEFIRQLSLEEDIEIVAIPFDVVLTKQEMPYERISFLSNDEIRKNPEALRGVDVLVHTAFCRKSIGTQLMSSLDYLEMIADAAIRSNVGAFINMSSQSVYSSSESSVLPTEEGRLNPSYLYALAKAVSEKILSNMVKYSGSGMKYANARIASMIGVSNDVPRNVLFKFICQALNGNDLTVAGGKQRFSFIDVSDVACAVKKLCVLPPEQWSTAYNVGPQKQTSITEMAETVCRQVNAIKHTDVRYIVREEDIFLNTGMDSSLLYQVTGWKPEHDFEQIVAETIDYICREDLA